MARALEVRRDPTIRGVGHHYSDRALNRSNTRWGGVLSAICPLVNPRSPSSWTPKSGQRPILGTHQQLIHRPLAFSHGIPTLQGFAPQAGGCRIGLGKAPGRQEGI